MSWPGINAELAELLSNCSACIENRLSLQREPLVNHKAPSEPYQKVGIDLFISKVEIYNMCILLCELSRSLLAARQEQ